MNVESKEFFLAGCLIPSSGLFCQTFMTHNRKRRHNGLINGPRQATSAKQSGSSARRQPGMRQHERGDSEVAELSGRTATPTC